MENEEFKRKYQKKSKKTNKFLGRESVFFFWHTRHSKQNKLENEES